MRSEFEDQGEGSQTDLHRIELRYLIKALLKFNASDLHIRAGRPPLFRVNGNLVPAKMEELSQVQVEMLLKPILTEKTRAKLEADRQVDFSFGVAKVGRFRCNVYFQKGLISAAIRMIPTAVPRLESLGLPSVIKDLCHQFQGLTLITGATGSGKSTTLSAMIDEINRTESKHILILEDPIEFMHRDKKSMITQRELGSDVVSLKEALRGGLRQDPDVIVIGELRDAETIQAALLAAETGHLVLGTLHTRDAKSSVDRMIEVFPADARTQLRYQLAACLNAVISQQLIERLDRRSRVPACEVMIKSPTIETYIREYSLERINDAIAGSNHYYQMQTMNQALHRLVNAGAISEEEALRSSTQPEDLKLAFSGMVRGEGYLPKAS
ncbi:MAG: PilT/PilU family type 4a pilus ATPase [Bdellovibrionales bacterium]|nr:PilT/PilU family type 4a pilus ATPase [Bdellovibrionales bacterium]